MSQHKIVIIGAGVSGLFTAYYLNKAGYSVTIIDKSDGTNNCSYGNAGMIVPSHIIPLAAPGIISSGLKWMLDAESPFYIRPRFDVDLLKWGWIFNKYSTAEHVKNSGPVLRDLLLKSRELFEILNEEEDFDFGFSDKGLFMLCNTEKGLQKEIEAAEKAIALGIPAKVLTKEDIQKKEPNLDFEIVGGTYFPRDAHLHPGSLMDHLKSLLKNQGVEFLLNTEIRQFGTDNSKITNLITSENKSIEADQVVMCNGIWSYHLGKTLGKNLIMQGGKGYSITLDDPPVQPEFCGILSEKKVTFTPMMNSLRFAGTMEITGFDVSINLKKINGLKKAVSEYLPQFKPSDLSGQQVWAGLRPIAPDGLPYIGKASGFKNLFISTGHAMMGMSLAPASGLLITELISNGSSELFHPMISPDRFN